MDRLQTLRTLLTPSRVEAVFGIITTIIVMVLLVSPDLYKGSEFETYFTYVKEHPTQSVSEYEALSAEINSSELAANSSVFFVWAVVGMIGYIFVGTIFRMFALLAHFRSELDYTHTDKRKYIIEAIIHLAVRLSAAGALYLVAALVLMRVTPVIVLLTRTITVHPPLIIAINSLLVAGIILTIIHISTVLLRLVVLRTRVFLT